MNKFELTLHYEFEDNDYEYDVEVDADDYADYLFDQLLSAKRTSEAHKAVVEMIRTLDLYDIIEDYGFIDWLKEAHEDDAQEQYGYDKDANDVRGIYD